MTRGPARRRPHTRPSNLAILPGRRSAITRPWSAVTVRHRTPSPPDPRDEPPQGVRHDLDDQPNPHSSVPPFTQTFHVTGMTCDHCVRAVTAEVGPIDGVTAVTVDLPTGQVSVGSDQPIDSDRGRRPRSTRPATRWPDP